MEWPWLKLHQRHHPHHPCCRPFCPVALEPSDAAFFSFPGMLSQRGLTFGPSRVQRACFAGQECTHRPTLLAVALTGIYENSTKIHFHIPWKSLFSSHALLFFSGNPRKSHLQPRTPASCATRRRRPALQGQAARETRRNAFGRWARPRAGCPGRSQKNHPIGVPLESMVILCHFGWDGFFSCSKEWLVIFQVWKPSSLW